MKKMLIGAFAGAFALCAQADITTVAVAAATLPTGTSFENYDSGTVIDLAKDDTGGDNGSYWCTTNTTDTTLTVSNLTDYAAYDKSCGVPAIDGRTTNGKYVKIDANNRVYRTAVAGASIDSDTGAFSAGTQLNFEDKPLFFDSMVLFTATDGLQTSDISSEDKLVVWLYGYEDGGSDTLGTGTNLVITAGYLDEQGIPTATNYVVSSESLAIEPNTWHRLTIKALRSDEIISGASISVFQIWVDGEKVSGSAGEGTAVSIFPSLVYSVNVEQSKDACSIVGVAFKGNGAVDDVSFTATAPEFAQEQIAQEFTLNVTLDDDNEIVDGITYSVDSASAAALDFAKGTEVANTLPLGDELVLVATLGDTGYIEGWTDAGDSKFTTNINITAQAAASALALTIKAVWVEEPSDPVADDGSSNTFTVPSTVVTTLKGLGAVVEGDKTLLNSRQVKSTDPVTYSTLTYGQAYALGVLNMETGDIGDIPAVTISFNADGQPVVSMGSGAAKTDVYTITCTLEYKDDLGATGDFAEFDPAVTAEIGENLTDATALKPDKRFYQVKITITDKSAQTAPAGE